MRQCFKAPVFQGARISAHLHFGAPAFFWRACVSVRVVIAVPACPGTRRVMQDLSTYVADPGGGMQKSASIDNNSQAFGRRHPGITACRFGNCAKIRQSRGGQVDMPVAAAARPAIIRGRAGQLASLLLCR
ncbi:hypothetical protein [Stappia sp.]|uniref:hypothetical protein n=1 Tax=Stappia sp. TaxID=1870903 RepID=UPI003D10A27C